jgi:hypothetical protein
MSEQAQRSDVDELVTTLQRRATAYEEACDRVAEAGEQRLQRLQKHYEQLTALFENYESRIVSDGDGEVDMEAFIEYQDDIAHFFDHLPEDLPHRADFEAVDDIMHERYLKTTDFDAARDSLSEVAGLVERLDERERTRERLAEARRDAELERKRIDERIDRLERLVELGDADLDAPVEHLREPVDAYNEAVTEAFAAFTDDASAREVLAFVDSTTYFPLVGFRQPPDDLRTYVAEYDAGTESIAQLLEYADYSVSKLDHYVDNARALKRNVATHRTYLQRLDAEPLTIGWPPPTADRLRFQCRELVSVVARFDPEESVLSSLRTVRGLASRDDYAQLRDSAVARRQLDDEERERLKTGAVQDELTALRERRDRLDSALEEYDPV